MPSNSWIGSAGDGVWGTAGNWSAGTIPATGEDVTIAPNTPTAISIGASYAAVDLESLTITGPVTIGSASTSLTIAVSNSASSTLRVSSSGPYVNIAAGTNGIDKAVIIGTSGGVFRVSGGTYAILEVGQNANVEIEASGVVTALKQAGGSVNAAAGTTFTTAYISAGNFASYRSCATMRVAGQATIATMRNAAAVSTLLTVTGGAVYDHQSSGTIASVVCEANSVCSANRAPKPFIVTASEEWAGGDIFSNTGVVITYTAAKVPVGSATAF
jgi:hypothetical protein